MDNANYDPVVHEGWTLFKAIAALSAYDGGCTDSGVRDEALREAVQKHLEGLDENAFRQVVSRFARLSLTNHAIASGYGLADVVAFVKWLDEYMALHV